MLPKTGGYGIRPYKINPYNTLGEGLGPPSVRTTDGRPYKGFDTKP